MDQTPPLYGYDEELVAHRQSGRRIRKSGLGFARWLIGEEHT